MMLTMQQWENAPETQRAYRRRLINWGWHYFGGLQNLGYPDHASFSLPPDKRPTRPAEYIGFEDAKEVEYVISSCAQASLRNMRYAIILRTEYVQSHLPQEIKARMRGMSRSTYQRRREEAEYWFYTAVLTIGGAAKDKVKSA